MADFKLAIGQAKTRQYTLVTTAFDDVSTYDFWFTVKASLADTDENAKIALTDGSGISVVNDGNGDPMVVQCAITEVQSATLTAGSYFFDFWMKPTGMSSIRIDSGKVLVTQPVTRDTTP